MVVSVKDVAKRAEVSVGTVSNVLNRPERVAPATRQRVLDAVSELGFVRNEAARALRAGRSRTIGLVVLDIANPFFTDVTRGAEAVSDEHGVIVTLCNSAEDPERERRHLDHLEEQRVQGVLLTPVLADSPRVEQLRRRGIPVVLVDRASGAGNQCSVAVDDVLGGRVAAEHLVEGGHRHIAFVGGPLSLPQVTDRLAGLRDVADKAGVRVTEVPTTALDVASGREAGALLARDVADRSPTGPTGVFCANDLLALGVLQSMTSAGLTVPADVALVGYDDIEFAAAAAVPLSSVRQPRELLGRTAAELLLDEVANPDTHRHRYVVFQPELVVRASSRASLLSGTATGAGVA